MTDKGHQITTYARQWKLTKQEISDLKAFNNVATEYVTKNICTRLNLEPNKKWDIQWSLRDGIIKAREKVDQVSIDPVNWTDVLKMPTDKSKI